MVDQLQCSSCKKRVSAKVGTTTFSCPQCGKHTIVRCGSCRRIVAKYSCPGCGFEGPN
ncbi:RNA-binding protein [Candidatus Woesearchaeota archaeon]|nr:RNA-binding protein [Candidatus Woesearchaeota archaeon]